MKTVMAYLLTLAVGSWPWLYYHTQCTPL